MSVETTEPTVERLVATWLGNQHDVLRYCPVCQVDLSRVGITSIVYTHEVCSCGVHDFDHLVEQMWHRECFTAKTSETITRELADLPADAAIEMLRLFLGAGPGQRFLLSLPELIERAKAKARRRHEPWREPSVELVDRCELALRVAGRLA